MSTTKPVGTEDITKNGHFEIFTLFYRYGNVPSLCENFLMPQGTPLVDAIQKGRQHCLSMNYKFLYVKPFIYDMETAEQKKKSGGTVPEHLTAVSA